MSEEKSFIIQHTFVRFLVIGLTSNTLSFSLFVLIFLISNNIILSSTFSYLLGVSTSFYFGKIWVFDSSRNFQISEIIKFLVVYFFGGLGMILIIIYLNEGLEIGYKLSWIGGAVFAIINNYFGSKYIVFKNKKS